MRIIRFAAGCSLFLVSLIVYCVTLSSGAYPGESAQFITQIAGLFPSMSAGYPLWSMLAKLMSAMPFGDTAFRLNLLSALCGAASVWLMFEVMCSAVLFVAEEDDRFQNTINNAALSAGIISALCMAFCVPFWMASTRAHFLGFDIMMLLLACRLICIAAKDGGRYAMYGLAFLSGLMFAESATYIMFLPVFAIWVMMILWEEENIRPMLVVSLIGLFAAGLSLYFLAALVFKGSEGYELRGYTSYWHVLLVMAQDQYTQIARSLPKQKWLIILMVTVVPWVAAVMSGRRGLNGERGFWIIALHALLTAISVCVVLNIAYLSPWKITGGTRLLVTPYVLSASVLGYLAAYWILFFKTSSMQTESMAWERVAPVMGYSTAVCMALLVAVMPFINVQSADGRKARLVAVMCSEVISSLEGRTWLVSNGFLDDHLLIAAKDRGIKLNIVSMKGDFNEIYAKYNASKFTSPRLKNLANIGTLQMVQEWLNEDKKAASSVALLSEPDIWYGAGMTPVPNKMVFFGLHRPDAAAARKAYAVNSGFWKKILETSGIKDVSEPILKAYIAYMMRHASMAANNLGVMLEDFSLNKEAFDSYASARKLDSDNISALLNMSVMADSGQKASVTENVKKEIEELVKNQKVRYSAWTLARTYGYIRHPQTFVDCGWTWALSGQPGIAASGFKRAMALAPADKKSIVKQQMAEFYLAQDMGTESEAIFRELLAADPKNIKAMVGLIRILEHKGDVEGAGKLLEKAEQAGMDKSAVSYELAMLRVLSGDNDKARLILQELIQLKPGFSPAWYLLADVLSKQKDREGLEELTREADKVRAMAGLVDYARAKTAMLKGDWSQALSYTEKALSRNQANMTLLVQAMRLNTILSRPDDAVSYATMILKKDPSHAFANYIMGSVMSSRDNYVQAKDFLAKSAEKERTVQVLNDLAWVCFKLREYKEAEKLVLEALRMDEKMYTAWDTLGAVMMETGRLDEAGDMFNKSIACFAGDLRVHLNLAELYTRKGDKAKASEVVLMLKKNILRLSISDQERLTRIAGSIR